MQEISVVIVTFNRSDLLIGTINSILHQTHPVSDVYIINNSSTDGTVDRLISEGFVNDAPLDEWSSKENVHLFNSSANTGGSGGFSIGIKKALEDKASFIWIMDDDVCPKPECLECLIAEESDEVGVYVPNRTCDLFNDYAVVKYNMTNPLLYSFKTREKRIYSLEERTYAIDAFPFEGPLISKDAIRKIGFPNANYFLQCDDYDYAFRLSKVTKMLFVTGAALERKLPLATKKPSDYWRLYYSLRNVVYLDKTYGKNAFVRHLRPWLLFMDYYLKAFLKGNFKKMVCIKKAYSDGNKRKLGKTVEPGSI